MSSPPMAVVYVPVVQAFPVFAGVHQIQTPPEWGKEIDPALWGIINASNVYTVRQHLKLLPKKCCMCPPCAPQTATYSLYAGPAADSQHELMRFDEVSDDWNRCCCRPYHSFKLEARQHIPMPGEDVNRSDYSFLSSQVANDWDRFRANPVSRDTYLSDLYAAQPVLFTIQRNDGVRCCYKCPCKLLSCPVLCSFCQDGVHVYAGTTPNHPEDPKKELGRPYGLPQELAHKLMGSVEQPIFGGCCIPFQALRDGPDVNEPFGKTTGPCFFGGWSEMCCDFAFNVSRFTSDRNSADLAKITKRAPVTASQAAATLCCNGDADVYSLEYNPQGNMTPQQKVVGISSLLLIDAMYFDGQMKKWDIKDEVLVRRQFDRASNSCRNCQLTSPFFYSLLVLLLLLLFCAGTARPLPDLHSPQGRIKMSRGEERRKERRGEEWRGEKRREKRREERRVDAEKKRKIII